jgi:hypothetical protein
MNSFSRFNICIVTVNDEFEWKWQTRLAGPWQQWEDIGFGKYLLSYILR